MDAARRAGRRRWTTRRGARRVHACHRHRRRQSRRAAVAGDRRSPAERSGRVAADSLRTGRRQPEGHGPGTPARAVARLEPQGRRSGAGACRRARRGAGRHRDDLRACDRIPSLEEGRSGRHAVQAADTGAADPADIRPHRPCLPRCRAVSARACRARASAGHGPARPARALLSRHHSGDGGRGRPRRGGYRRIPAGARAVAERSAGQPAAWNGARGSASREGSARPARDRREGSGRGMAGVSIPGVVSLRSASRPTPWCRFARHSICPRPCPSARRSATCTISSPWRSARPAIRRAPMPSSPRPQTAEERTTSGRDALDRFMQDMADAPGAEATTMLPLDPEGSARCRPPHERSSAVAFDDARRCVPQPGHHAGPG